VTNAIDTDRAGRLRVSSTLVFLGFGLQLLQVGIIPLLPLIGKDLKLTTGTAAWLVTASLLSGVVFLAVFSRLADIIGKVPVIQLSLGLVLIGSLIGCFATGFTGLLVGRILMGAVMPMLALPEAVASDTMPRERASVVIAAIHGGTGTGIAGGLILGGLAGAGEASWRWFFIVGAIASAIGILASWAWLHDAAERAAGSLDFVGAALLAVGLGAVLLAVSEGPTWGWGTVRVWGLGIAGLLVMVGWWRQQRRTRYPLIDTRQLISEEIRLPLAMTFIAAFGIYGSLSALSRFVLSPPAVVGYGYGWEPLQIAWYAIPQTIGCVAGFLLIRSFVRQNRPVQALAIGFGILVTAFLLFGLLLSHPFFTLLALCLDSLGLATILALTQIVLVRSVPASESGIVLGLAIILYTLGNAIGTAVVAVFFQSFGSTPEAPSLSAFKVAYAFGGVAAVVCLTLCVPLARRMRGGWPTRVEAGSASAPASGSASATPARAQTA
jgi:MFS family permease